MDHLLKKSNADFQSDYVSQFQQLGGNSIILNLPGGYRLGQVNIHLFIAGVILIEKISAQVSENFFAGKFLGPAPSLQSLLLRGMRGCQVSSERLRVLNMSSMGRENSEPGLFSNIAFGVCLSLNGLKISGMFRGIVRQSHSIAGKHLSTGHPPKHSLSKISRPLLNFISLPGEAINVFAAFCQRRPIEEKILNFESGAYKNFNV
jgi:hypothetical protein